MDCQGQDVKTLLLEPAMQLIIKKTAAQAIILYQVICIYTILTDYLRIYTEP